ncbi:MAG: YhcH/YjgK/YiaL family protein [Clostridiales bacterium]|nr:YhcH/YjgK/YiaL family protein [Clostridiales bacterium]
MIFGNLKQLNEFKYLDEAIKECFHYASEHDLLHYEKGSHPIDGDRLFVNIVEYTTTTPENRFWEAHRDYLDLHLMLNGCEQIDLNFIDNMEQKEFVPKDDFLPLEGEPNSHVVLRDGDFLICYPNDGHRTAVAVNEPQAIKKAIFKIRIQ